MVELKCRLCGMTFYRQSPQNTCSIQCGYTFRSQNQQKWNRSNIIKEIKNLHKMGFSLNSNQLKKNGHGDVVIASYKYLGSWREAVNEAGFVSVNKKWSKNKILKQIYEWSKNNYKLNYSTVNMHNANFMSAVSRYFSSWDAALLEAGIPNQRCYIEWSGNKVIRIAKQQYKMGHPMHLSAIRNRDSKLYGAALNRFGSWKNVLKKSDIPDVPYESKWNAKIVKRWLRKISEKQISLNSNYFQKNHDTFHSAAVRYFGSWDNALRAVDINPLDVKRSGFWRPELVITKIKERNDRKESLYSNDVAMQYSSLRSMGKRFFGSWKKAIQAAGLAYKRKVPHLWGEEILGLVLSEFFPDKKFVRNCRELDWLVGIKGHYLELDFYCEDLKLGLEFQGPTHSRPVFGEKELSYQQARDARKRRLCDENGLKLIEIHYNDFSPKTLSQKLFEYDIIHRYSEARIAVCNKYKLSYQ